MRRYILCSVLAVVCCGCRGTRPRWEIVVTVQYDQKVNPDTKVSGGLTFKRPILGNTPIGGDKKPSETKGAEK
jgi:hypothetical protein